MNKIQNKISVDHRKERKDRRDLAKWIGTTINNGKESHYDSSFEKPITRIIVTAPDDDKKRHDSPILHAIFTPESKDKDVQLQRVCRSSDNHDGILNHACKKRKAVPNQASEMEATQFESGDGHRKES